MARPKAKAPARRYHMSGQSVVTIAGRDFYLGTHDSPESIARYAALVAIYQQGNLTLPAGFELASLDPQVAVILGGISAPQHQADTTVLVRHVTALYREHINEKYQNAKQEKHRHLRLCDQVDELFADILADQFGPVRLKEFRAMLVNEGLSRKYINRLTNCVVGIFKHAVAGELVEVNVFERLRTLEPLRKGQTIAPEKERTAPVPLETVRKTAEHLSPIIKAMLRIQVATGMRPKELCMMRPCDIDRKGEVWIYRPSEHKTQWCGKDKAIPIVGDAREAVTEFLQRSLESYCFSPKEAMAWRHAQAAARRKTPKKQGNRPGSNRKKTPKRLPRERYDSASYRQAIARAIVVANVEKWTPYQIRHLTATEVRAALGIEDTKALLGHSTALMTEHYARESEEAATRAANAAPKL
ncbi:tyrosine-type recombinase/integrase [Roseiconus lacunae]|uniref:tyrosine-type recombinase/integrase n=1 Tax=Roseiconus lacunae TaxID=2605694 RepID=UPI001E5D4312|nr:site-specific integrase [Roseiconus lacunae]MCD0459972.1 site-specific integrase [Roseiconus lacunae]